MGSKIRLMLALLAGSAPAFFISSNLINPRKPNIIIFSIDTLRADHLSCYGYPRQTSPHIDVFSEQSVFFQKAVTQAPTTAPAHMSIFTSLPPSVHQTKNRDLFKKSGPNLKTTIYKRLDLKIETLASVLKKNGYHTLGFHGGGSLSSEFGFDRGFDLYREWGDMRKVKKLMEDVRQAFAEGKKKRQPIFVFLHHYICHDPYLSAPQEFGSRFLTEKAGGLPLSVKDIGADASFEERRERFWKLVNPADASHMKHVVSLYDGAVYYSDYIFGKLIETLKEEGVYDSSVIILVSDHGEEFYEHSDIKHWRLFNETLHVPLIIKFPSDRFGGRKVGPYVRTMDIMPTLLDFLKIKTDILMRGVSFLPLIDGKGSYSPDITSYADCGGSLLWKARFIKDGFVYSNQPSLGVEEWLFAVNSDPGEQNNLILAKPEVASQMQALAKVILKRDLSFKRKIDYRNAYVYDREGELFKKMKSLGYVQ